MSTKSLLLALVTLSLLAACVGEPLETPRGAREETLREPIVGGRRATLEEFHGTVGLYYPEWSVTDCTGTIIAPDVVMTAGHCVVDYDHFEVLRPAEIQVVAGLLDATSPTRGYLYDVRRVALHPDYEWDDSPPPDGDDLQDFHDVALLVLTEPVQYLRFAPTMTLADFDATVDVGTLLTISGYGLEHPDDRGDSMILNIADTPFQRRSNFEILAGLEGSPDTCSGDSGGPAYLNVDGEMYLVGVTSRGIIHDTIMCGAGGVYALVPAYLDWLEGELGERWPPSDVPVDGDADGDVDGDADGDVDGDADSDRDPRRDEKGCGKCSTSAANGLGEGGALLGGLLLLAALLRRKR